MAHREHTGAASSGAASGRSRACADCKKSKPVSEFHVKTRDENGHPKTYQSYCKDCQRERTRFSAYLRRRRQGLPEVGPYKIKRGHRPTRELVDAEPFRRWVEHHCAVKSLTIQDLATRVGYDEKQIRQMLQTPSVSLGTVDQILVESGTNTQLVELYPYETRPL